MASISDLACGPVFPIICRALLFAFLHDKITHDVSKITLNYLFSKYLLSDHYGLGTVLGTGKTATKTKINKMFNETSTDDKVQIFNMAF